MNRFTSETVSMNPMESTEEILRRVTDEYRKTVELPESKPRVPYLLCPVGLVGAGKSTVIIPLAKRLSLVRISTDEIRRLIGERGEAWDRVPEAAYALVREFAFSGYAVAIDSDCAAFSEQIINEAEKYGLPVFWIHIDPPEDFIIRKLTSYGHSWLFRDADEALATYRERKAFHEHLTMPFTFRLDPSRDDIRDQIEACARIIEWKTNIAFVILWKLSRIRRFYSWSVAKMAERFRISVSR